MGLLSQPVHSKRTEKAELSAKLNRRVRRSQTPYEQSYARQELWLCVLHRSLAKPNSLRAIIRPAGVLASHTPPEFDGVKLPTGSLTKLDCPSHLAGTNAAGAGVDVLGRTVHHSLYSSYIGLPGPVGSSMRMGNLNAKSNTLTADIALCHLSAPPSGYR